MSDGLPPEAAPFWAAITGVFGAALGACGLWLASRMMGKAAFQTAINQGFQGLTDQLQEERDFFRRQLAEERVSRAAIEAGNVKRRSPTTKPTRQPTRRAS